MSITVCIYFFHMFFAQKTSQIWARVENMLSKTQKSGNNLVQVFLYLILYFFFILKLCCVIKKFFFSYQDPKKMCFFFLFFIYLPEVLPPMYTWFGAYCFVFSKCKQKYRLFFNVLGKPLSLAFSTRQRGDFFSTYFYCTKLQASTA